MLILLGLFSPSLLDYFSIYLSVSFCTFLPSLFIPTSLANRKVRVACFKLICTTKMVKSVDFTNFDMPTTNKNWTLADSANLLPFWPIWQRNCPQFRRLVLEEITNLYYLLTSSRICQIKRKSAKVVTSESWDILTTSPRLRPPHIGFVTPNKSKWLHLWTHYLSNQK